MSNTIHDVNSRIIVNVKKGCTPSSSIDDTNNCDPSTKQVGPSQDLLINKSAYLYTTFNNIQPNISGNNNTITHHPNSDVNIFIKKWSELPPINGYNNKSLATMPQQQRSESINLDDLMAQNILPPNKLIKEPPKIFKSPVEEISSSLPKLVTNSAGVNVSPQVNSYNNVSMKRELYDILNSIATNSNNNSHTHVSLYGPHAIWNIPSNDPAFWIRYCDLVDRMNNGGDGIPANSLSNICLAERPQETQPLITKFTFKFKINKGDILGEVYNNNFLQWICHIYQTAIMEYFNVNILTKLELNVVILESTDCDYYYNIENGQHLAILNIRLQFPYACIDVGIQNRLIRSRIIQLLRNNNVLNKMQHQPIDEWEQIISINVANEPVVMYGSNELQGQYKLELTHIWSHITREMLDREIEPEEITLEDAFIPQNHSHIQQSLISPNIFENDNNLEHWLPIFLSLGYWSSILQPKREINDGDRFTLQLKSMNTPQEHIPEPISEPIINSAILRHRDKGISLLDIAMSGYHSDIVNAMLFCCFKEPEIIDIIDCYSIIYDTDTSEIYLWNFTDLLWKRHDHSTQGSHPKIRCFDDIISKYTDMRKILSKQIKDSNDETLKSNNEISIKRITTLIGKLKTRQFRDSIWKELLEIVELKFSVYRDKINPYLPLNDGTLFNIFTHESRLRTPKDHFTFTINGHIANIVTSIKPLENSSEAHKFSWNFFLRPYES